MASCSMAYCSTVPVFTNRGFSLLLGFVSRQYYKCFFSRCAYFCNVIFFFILDFKSFTTYAVASPRSLHFVCSLKFFFTAVQDKVMFRIFMGLNPCELGTKFKF